MASLNSRQLMALIGKIRSALSRIYQDTPLSTIQARSLRHSETKDFIRINHAKFAAPESEEGDIHAIIESAIRLLGRGDEQYTMPTLSDVEVEWTNPRSEARSQQILCTISEKERFERLNKNIKNQPTIVYVYGGAFYLNSPPTARPLVAKLVEATGFRCCTIGYRLAPQHPFPSALIDVFLAYLCLLYPTPASYHSPVSAASVIFVGESSGATLILSLVQLILAARQAQSTDVPRVGFRGVTVPIPMPAGIAIISPGGDQTNSLPSWLSNAPYDIFSRDTSPLTDKAYPSCPIWPTNPPRSHVYCETSMLCHPLVSPAAARNWKGCPPLWLAMGQERLADSGKVIAQTAARQGVVVLWETYEQMPHTWITILPQLWQAEYCIKRCAEVVRMLGKDRAVESGGEKIPITGERKKIDVRQLTNLTGDNVEELMRANTRLMKPWTGGSRAMSKL